MRILLLCHYDPEGIATVTDTVTGIQRHSQHGITLFNLFDAKSRSGTLALPADIDLAAYDAIVIHNTVSYNAYNLHALDMRSRMKLCDFPGIKVLMKQDENHRMHCLAQYIGETGFDIVFTCLGENDIPKVYPPEMVGTPRFERMLTGYVMPSLRERAQLDGPRDIDVGYRGSIQPLSFGRLAYEKRQIGEEVEQRLQDSGLTLDISSQWEDRIGGEAWFGFMRRCKAILGCESGASVFDLDGELDKRCQKAERELGKPREDKAYAEAYLAYFADLEGNVDYAQISPRHFEAAASGALQLLYPGQYSGIFEAGKHYFPLARDFSNLQEAVSLLRDEPKRRTIVQQAHDDIIMNPRYWIETFVQRFDALIQETHEQKQPTPNKRAACGLSLKKCFLHIAIHIWIRLPAGLRTRIKPFAARLLAFLQTAATCKSK